MRALIQFSFLGWICLIGWGVTLWFRADFICASHKLNTLLVSQSKALPSFKFLTKKTEKTSAIRLPSLSFGLLRGSPQLQMFTSDVINKSMQMGRLASVATQCMLIKLMLLIMAIPLLSVTTLVGLVDGLNQRAIRTACLGRESSYLFHQLKRYSQKGLNVFLGVWLVLPLSITPALVFIPMSLFTGMITAITVSHFKKYY